MCTLNIRSLAHRNSMRFFFPDSLDTVDPRYDFEKEQHAPDRVRHRDDVFAHQYLDSSPYDGILVSKALVDGYKGQRRYHDAQRVRLLRTGVRRFFGLEDTPLKTMGDCGAYAYVTDPEPPFSVDDVLEFYSLCQFDYVLSVDHVIPGFIRPKKKRPVPQDWIERQNLTHTLADRFLRKHQRYELKSIPIGSAQGWNPVSYAQSAVALEEIGYQYIALGGMASLQTPDILTCIDAVRRAVQPSTKIHLLGISRIESFDRLLKWGIASFDSTMPLRQAFMDDKHNYHTSGDAYLALRVPPSSGNSRLARLVQSGERSAVNILTKESNAVKAIDSFAKGTLGVEETVAAIHEYEHLYNERDHREAYRRLLCDRPWKQCSCRACRELGIQVVVFRGRERNKRRGYHNLSVFARKLASSASGHVPIT